MVGEILRGKTTGLMTGAVRLQRDRLADAEFDCEALKGALKRLERDISEQEGAEYLARSKVRAAVGRVLVEALDPLIARVEELEAQRLSVRSILREIDRFVPPGEVEGKRIRSALSEKLEVSEPTAEVLAWRRCLEELGKDAAAPLPAAVSR